MVENLLKIKKLVNSSLIETNAFWEPICKQLMAVLSKKYRLPFVYQSAMASLSTYDALTMSAVAEGPYLASVFRAEGIRSPVFFKVDGRSGARLCHLLLGGSTTGGGEAVDSMDLQIAPISRQLEARFLQVFASFMAGELSKFGLGKLRYGSSETDLRLFSQIPGDINCLQTTVSFLVGELPIKLAMFLPLDAAKRLALQKNLSDDSQAVHTLSYKHLQDLEVDVAVALGTLNMTLKELVSLVPGEVLSLDRLDAQDAQLRIEGKYFKSGQLENGEDHKWKFLVIDAI
jgi:flagellar motor switch/type III secretory pathway protein FliN